MISLSRKICVFAAEGIFPINRNSRKRWGLSKKSGSTSGLDRAVALLELEEFAQKLPTELSHGQRKLVGVARALSSEPRLLMLDEPAAGLDSSETAKLGSRLQSIVANGTTVLMIDHDMGLVLAVCDYIYMLDFGQLRAQGTPAQIRTNDHVLKAYLGERGGESVSHKAEPG